MQMTAMFLNMWNKHGHVCENFSPFEDADECAGDKIYHWGALAGVIDLAHRRGLLLSGRASMSMCACGL